MPIQAPQWTDYLNCPVCCREFGTTPRSPVSLVCGHTVCMSCLSHLHRRQCPFDQTDIHVDPEELVVNTALLQLAGFTPPVQPYHPPSIQILSVQEKRAYDTIVKCNEQLAVFLKYCSNANNNVAGSRLSRPMQRKLVTLLQCAITDEEGRGKAARVARSLGERSVTELILQLQNPQQLSANLWAAVRARGCQFLGPAMQEEVLKLVLLVLEDGSALSRKVLVMFVVQRLEPHFPQASKTSIGHVVQLLYRASCFKVSKRDCESSLMQLKDEFRTYEALRREHDAQIVQIATEAGLRIAPDQWSALLYGDTSHKSHMQSIIDKLQTPQSFAQSVQELFVALQRTGDPTCLVLLNVHLDRLTNIDPSPEAKSPSLTELADILTSLKDVVSGLINYIQHQATGRDMNHNQKYSTQEEFAEASASQPSTQAAAGLPSHKYKVSMCWDASKPFCPRGKACTFAHSAEELERYRALSTNQAVPNGTHAYVVTSSSMPAMPLPAGLPALPAVQQPVTGQPVPALQYPIAISPQPMFTQFSVPPPQHVVYPYQINNFNSPPLPLMNVPPPNMRQVPSDNETQMPVETIAPHYPPPIIQNQPHMNQGNVLVNVSDHQYCQQYGMPSVHDDNCTFPSEYHTRVFQPRPSSCPVPGYMPTDQGQIPPIFIMHNDQYNVSSYGLDDADTEASDFAHNNRQPVYVPVSVSQIDGSTTQSPTYAPGCSDNWPATNNVFDFSEMRNNLSFLSTPENAYKVADEEGSVDGQQIAAVADSMVMAGVVDLAQIEEHNRLVRGLEELERRLDNELSTTYS